MQTTVNGTDQYVHMISLMIHPKYTYTVNANRILYNGSIKPKTKRNPTNTNPLSCPDNDTSNKNTNWQRIGIDSPTERVLSCYRSCHCESYLTCLTIHSIPDQFHYPHPTRPTSPTLPYPTWTTSLSSPYLIYLTILTLPAVPHYSHSTWPVPLCSSYLVHLTISTLFDLFHYLPPIWPASLSTF